MSRIWHLDDYKVSTTRELQEKVQRQKELEEKQRTALKEYQYKFGKIRGWTPESPESTTPTQPESSSHSTNKELSSTPLPASISSTSMEYSSPPSVAENTVSPIGVNRTLEFSKLSSPSRNQVEKPKLFQNLSFDVPVTTATAGQNMSIVSSHSRNQRVEEAEGGSFSPKRAVVGKLRRFVCF
ncbi:hypothetical protein GpartN1_g7536.t1 [Galdieria partita]|uniref:Uncharacterized protein n=1 Tax=Galdieria partita TaxID=83374 RepID=A0A9C7UUT2_9RHOD|nr:hypothetical protein GpartN1_g7536.t1 [Galdieria partita]